MRGAKYINLLGGEFETFVIYCPLFKRELKVVGKEISGEGNSWKMEIKVE